MTISLILLHDWDLISIHTFLAEGDAMREYTKITDFISIHTFLAEGDPYELDKETLTIISIHTFLAEGDVDWPTKIHQQSNFNPHLPCGR